ncbi:hypothetical protein [Nocardia nova]|uniref:hypothetical protein n=1 Tax=Nocardia nova TaxID=37330 RepID=UPI0033F0A00A
MTALDEHVGFTDPDYWHDSPTHTERQLRADFARSWQLREIASFAATAESRDEFRSRASELAMRWGNHESEHWRGTWEGLQRMAAGWQTRPELARRNFNEIARGRARGDVAIDDDVWRSMQQARQITGHGTGAIGGSEQDAARRHPYLLPDLGASPPAADDHVDRRTPVQRTLGAPRNFTTAPSLEQVDSVIAATDALLDAEEAASDLDDGREARKLLLPRAVREAPVSHDYSQTDTWDRRHIESLREIQDLAAEHSNLADHLDGSTDDQARINRLDRLRSALTAARRDGLASGLTDTQVQHAYTTGRDGTYWSTQPSDPRLGRIAQLTEHRDYARAAAETRTTPPATEPAPSPTAMVADTGTIDTTPVETPDAGVGGGIATDNAVTIALAGDQPGVWEPSPAEPIPNEVAPQLDHGITR